MKTKTDIHSVIRATRRRLVMDHVWFGTLAMFLEFVISEDIELARTDGIVLEYNKTWFESLPKWFQDYVVAHEILHCALGHIFRLKGRDLNIANIAADHIVNIILRNCGFRLPPDAYCDDRFSGMSFEKVYAILYSESQESKKNGQGKSADSGSGSAATSSTAPGQPGESDQQEDGDSQGSSDSTDQDGESESPTPGSSGDPRNVGGMQAPPASVDASDKAGQDKIKDLANEWARRVETTGFVSNKAGTTPGGVAQAVSESKIKQEDLSGCLQRYLTSKSTYTYSSPNRRMVCRGIYMPGRVRDKLSELVIFVDTSGSTGGLLSYFKDKINEVLAMSEAPEKITILYCDTRVTRVDEIYDGVVTFQPYGGGGTLFQPVFDKIEELGVQPDVLIGLTDLENGDRTLTEPDYPVLWVAPIQTTAKAKFGETILVDPFKR